MKLTDEQQEALEIACGNSRDNLLILGKAGVGKSVTTREIIKRLKDSNKNGFIAAPTGVAAINIGGQTLHRLIAFLKSIKKKTENGDSRKFNIDYVLIDEVSMLRVDMLDQLDIALRLAQVKLNAPFGGTKIILVGDLAQLPPVVKTGEAEFEYISDNYLSPYFFSANSFMKTDWKIIELTKIFRQVDQEYIQLLNLIRDGETERSIAALNQCCRVREPIGVFLASRNKDAEEMNNQKLAELEGDERIFECEAYGAIFEHEYPAPQKLKLKIGARVMIIKNIYNSLNDELELINGDWGEIVEFHDEDVMVAYDPEFAKENENSSIAIKCDRTGEVHWIHRAVWDKNESTYDSSEKKLFTEKIASFVQFPLRLAWAVTIHKSQGATIEELTIDMRSPMFCAGQLYVALSRGVSVEKLHIMGRVRPTDVMVCPIISKFLKNYKTGVGVKEGGKYDNNNFFVDA